MNNIGFNDRKMDHEKIAGVVVIYNSGNELLENIATYIDQIRKLYVVDNSDITNPDLIGRLQEIPSVDYVKNLGNLGIANALNKAAHKAIQDGFMYLLTMDDDSIAPANMIESMSSFLAKYPYADQIGILSVAHNKHKKSSYYKQVNLTMTSGNVLFLNAYKVVGDFNDELFIDHVDHEYNIRLQLKGFDIIELSNLKLIHKLGTVKKTSVLNKRITYISHSPLRLYYFVRNATYIIRTYYFVRPKFCLTIIWLSAKELMKSIFLENEKQLRISYFLQALRSGSQGKLGKFNTIIDK